MQFRSLNTSFLRKQGLAGEDVVVRLEGTTLVLKGDKHGSLAIPATSVDRLRQFKMEAVEANLSEFSADRSPGLYETKIWWSGKAKPLMLTPYEDFANYREIMRGFARQVAAVRGLERLYLGAGPTTAILNLLLVGIPVLFLFAYVLWLATAEGGSIGWVLPRHCCFSAGMARATSCPAGRAPSTISSSSRRSFARRSAEELSYRLLLCLGLLRFDGAGGRQKN